jgi:hypothetical protein
MATRHFFVDEAGDLTLFDKRGRSMLGREGVSQFFMVAVAEIGNPTAVGRRLEALRRDLLGDPYFAGASSLHPERRKTALTFHAKDDLPEVRWRVYDRLRRLDIKVAVALRRKAVLEHRARATFKMKGTKLRLDDVYDALVTHLFTGRLHDAGKHRITFAVRKTANRDAALMRAIDHARAAQGCAAQCIVGSDRPHAAPGLQVVDYFAWAVQRLFERAEGRFFAGIAKQIEYVWDLDDTRGGSMGVRYDRESVVLTPEKLLPLASARFKEALEHPA